MKKGGLILLALLLLLFITPVHADLFATIGMSGLGFVNPTAATLVRGALCATNPINCVTQFLEGKVVTEIYGQAFQAVAEISPEAAKAIVTYNQIKGYINTGAAIIEELQLDEEGEIQQGTISFEGTKGNLGKQLGFEKDEDVYLENVVLTFNQESYNEIIFKEKGKFWVPQHGKLTSFENIKSGDKETNAFLRLDQEGILLEADFTTNEKGGTYIFGENKPLVLSPDTRVTYKDDIITLYESEKTQKYGDIFLKALQPIAITQNQIACASCQINNLYLKGKVTVTDSGYLVAKNSFVEQDYLELITTRNAVLFAYPEADLTQYQGSWIKNTPKLFKAQSLEGEEIKVSFISGNELFNADDKDKLEMTITNGDSITARSREEKRLGLFGGGKIPEVIHRHSETGQTTIKNGRLTFVLNEELNVDVETFDDQTKFDLIRSGKYQSAPFQLASSSLGEGYELRVGSNNQFVLLDEEKRDSRVVFNRFGIPLSENLEDHKIQTLAQLQNKWKKRGITLEISEEHLSIFEDLSTSKEYTEVSPYMLQAVDHWLETHPDAELNYITFSDIANAQSGDISQNFYQRGILLGEQIFDPHTNQVLLSYSKDRNFDDPLTIITHEYEHVSDNWIDRSERAILEEKKLELERSNPELIDEAKKYAKSVVKRNGEITKNDIYWSFMIYPQYLIDEDKKRYEENKMYLAQNGYEQYRKKFKLHKDYPKQEIDRDIESYRTIYVQEIESNEIRDFLDTNDLDKTLERYEETIRDAIYKSKLYNEKRFYLERHIAKQPETKKLKTLYNELAVTAGAELVQTQNYRKAVDEVMVLLEKEKDKHGDDFRKKAERLLSQDDKYSPEGIFLLESIAYAHEDLGHAYESLLDVIEEKSGVPASYAYRDYGPEFGGLESEIFFRSGFAEQKNFHELSSTYREEPIEVRREKVQNGNPQQREVYTQLTQIAFDSGKMGHNEFKQIMGDICKKPDCCDQKCKIYKLGCTGACS